MTNCKSCNLKVGPPKNAFVCYFCGYSMHMNQTCTGFEEDQFKVLVELKQNLLMVCNDCKSKKSQAPSNSAAVKNNNDDLAATVKSLEKRMSDFLLSMEKSAAAVEDLKTEVANIKKPATETNCTGSYASVVGNKAPGKRVYKPAKDSLSIRIKGLPEPEDGMEDKLKDREKVKRILDHLDIRSSLTKLTRVGQPNPDKGPRTVIIDLDNDLDKEVMIKSAHKLKTYTKLNSTIFISQELTKEDMAKENEALKLRRDLIKKGVVSQTLRIRNLKLQQLVEGVWTFVSTVEGYKWLASGESRTETTKTLHILTFNVRSIHKLERRTLFANAICTSDYDLLCVTETWLTSDVPNSTLFLKEYAIYRSDRTSSSMITIHGGVLVAVKRIIPHEIIPNDQSDEIIAVMVITEQPLLVCCVYNPPHYSPFRWPRTKFDNLLTSLKRHQKQLNCQTTIITGDINFSKTSWDCMESRDDYEQSILDLLCQHGYSQHLNQTSKRQLDVLLSNNDDDVFDCKLDRKISTRYNVSDHLAYSTTMNTKIERKYLDPKHKQYSLKRADWDAFVDATKCRPFQPYCYSNVNVLIQTWYSWLNKTMDENLEKVTAHRASQAPWISKHTSHLKNILQTKKRANKKFSVAHSIKIKRLEKEIEASCQEDLRIYEETVFETRYFSRIQKYLSCIRKSLPLPNEFHYKGKIGKTESECANMFNSFFVSVFNQKDYPAQLPTQKSKLVQNKPKKGGNSARRPENWKIVRTR